MAKDPKKKKDKKDFPTISWTENSRARSHALLTEIEREENRVVFLGKRKGGNTSGDTKTKAGKRIAAKVIPEVYAIDPVAASKRCVDHWDGLVKKYKEAAKRLRKTGEGISDRDEEVDDDTQDKDEYLESYVGPQGPDETTTERIRNIWDQILEDFPLFPRLHALLSARANINPPQLTTGVGPIGRTVLHLQIEEEDQIRSAAEQAVSSADPGLPSRPSSPAFILDPRLQNQPIAAVAPRPSTFGSLRNSGMESTPVPSTSYGRTTATPGPSLESAVSKARNNSARPPKRTMEDRLFSVQDKALKNMKRVKREALSQSSRELALKEREQVIQMSTLGIISPRTAKQKLDVIDASTNISTLDSSPPSSPIRN
ncbi:hypothetical protein F5880DRAFT_1619042 [Lentinula raphanica]|nr:hypothetical protein F5880DRAFT_1619042 [Lentinula raphanica]